MAKWFFSCIGVLCALSLIANIYYIRMNMNDRQHAEMVLAEATGELQTAIAMQSGTGPYNTVQERGAWIMQAAGSLEAAAPLLGKIGIHHIEGLGEELGFYGELTMHPGVYGKHHPNAADALAFARITEKELLSAWDFDKFNNRGPILNLSKLKTAINVIYQSLPPNIRSDRYNEPYSPIGNLMRPPTM